MYLAVEGSEADIDAWMATVKSVRRVFPGLETDGNAVKVDLQMKTNIPGLFAAGDIAGRPYQYIKSAGQGNIAALSAVDYLASLR